MTPAILPPWAPWVGLPLAAVAILAPLALWGWTHVRRARAVPWWVDAAIAVTCVAVLVVGALYAIGSWYTGDWSLGSAKGDVPWSGFTRIAMPAVTLLIAVVAAVLAGHGHSARLTEIELTRDTQKVDMYSRGVEQLGSEQVSTRLGGIYSLQRLAFASRPDVSTIDQVLTAHLRLALDRLCGDHGHVNPPSGFPLESSRAEAVACLRVLSALRARFGHLADFDLGQISWPATDWPRGVRAIGVQAASADFSGVDLPAAVFTRADLKRADFSEAKLTDAVLTGADLEWANFRKANLIGAELSNANLSHAFLSEANLQTAALVKANLSEAHMQEASMHGANLVEANLHRANLDRADLERANLRSADLSNANLIGADLRLANLTGANLTQADLSLVNFADSTLKGTNLTGARIDQATYEQIDHLKELWQRDETGRLSARSTADC